MRRLCLFLLCLLPLDVHANWSGTWLGKGAAQKPHGPITSCREILLRLEENARELLVLEGHYICGAIHASFDPARLERRGTMLYYRGEKIGTLTREELRLNYVWDDGSTYRLSVERRGNGKASYQEVWTEEGATAFKVEGELRLQ